jgi:hypothetical protein
VQSNLTGATGQRLTEANNINHSLSCLGDVIKALTTSNTKFIPFRNSILTWILKESLGGNCKISFLVCVSPASSCYGETWSTLKFAERCKSIRKSVTINEIGLNEIGDLKATIKLLNIQLAALSLRSAVDTVDVSTSTQDLLAAVDDEEQNEDFTLAVEDKFSNYSKVELIKVQSVKSF